MEDKKQLLIQLIMEDNLSAIETFSNKLGISREDVVVLIKALQTDGKLHGILTSDEKRFFKSEVRVSEAPVIAHEEEEPSFLKFNARPGLITAFVGFVIMVVGYTANPFLPIQIASNVSLILIFIGLLVLIIGLFLVSQRKTPD